MIKYQKYDIPNNLIFTSDILNSYITQFWKDVFESIIKNTDANIKIKHLMIIVKIKYNENGVENYKTLAPLRRVEFNDLDLFSDYLSERLGLIIDSYNPVNINEIIFSYIIKTGPISSKDRLLLKDLSETDKLTFHEFNKIKLPGPQATQ
jgi:hypothetical protein